MEITSSADGSFIRSTTTQEEQICNAVERWSTRLNKWEYSKQLKKNKGKKLKSFSPNGFSLFLLSARKDMINGNRTPEETISLLHTVEGRTERRLCMEAGF